jgi:DNA-binding NtrC family response regulator
MERAVVLTRGTVIMPGDLPQDIIMNAEKTLDATGEERMLTIPIGKIPLRDIEKMVMDETLRQAKGNKNIASKILGISTRTLYRRTDEE